MILQLAEQMYEERVQVEKDTIELLGIWNSISLDDNRKSFHLSDYMKVPVADSNMEEPALDESKPAVPESSEAEYRNLLEETRLEAEKLKKDLKASEKNNKALLDERSQDRNRMKEMEKRLEAYENERAELIALRSYVYGLSEEYPGSKTEPLETMAAALRERKILIIGGHINWQNKLRSAFPSWSFIAPGAGTLINPNVLEGIEKACFFTDHISHSNYHRFVEEMRMKKIPFGYIHNVNVEQNIRFLYTDLNRR